MPTFDELYQGQASPFWNILCCPIIDTIGLVWISLNIFAFPCATVLCQQVMVNFCWRYLCCVFGWPYKYDDFFGSKALGNHSKQSGQQKNKEMDWVRAQDLEQFEGKRPTLSRRNLTW
jgi:hypothetical protein